MTKQEFTQLAAQPILLDGATGSRMLAAGMPRGCCTEQWIADHPEAIQTLQREYIQAGSHIIYAPTFGANRISLTDHGLGDQVRSLNRRLVAYSQAAAEGAAYVAGNVTTTGRILGVEEHYNYRAAYENYREQIQLLADSGVDLIAAETMIQFEEACAIVNACRDVCNLPILVTMTVRSNGTLYYGGSMVEYAPMLQSMGVSAVGINCSTAPDKLTEVVRSIAARVTIPVIAKPNAGIPRMTPGGKALYDITPREFSRHMKTLYQNGASILGGCCGTDPRYIRAIREMLQNECHISAERSSTYAYH